MLPDRTHARVIGGRRLRSFRYLLVLAMLGTALATPAHARDGARTRAGRSTPSGTLVDGLTNVSGMTATNDEVFIASGETGSTVAVMGVDGTQIGTLTGIPGPVALDVSATKLFVAAWGDSSIWVYTLTTSPPTKVDTLSTVPVQDPTSLALASGRLWYTGDSTGLGGDAAIGSMKTDGTDVQSYSPPDFEYWQYDNCGDLDHSTFAPARLFVHGNGCRNPDGVYEYSSAAAPPAYIADYGLSPFGTYYASPLDVMPDGSGIVVQRSSVLQVLDIDDLSLTSETYEVPGGSVMTGIVTGAPQGSATGGRIAGWGQSDPWSYPLYIWRVGDPQPTNVVVFPPEDGYYVPRGVAFAPSGDALFAVTRNDPSVFFHVVDPTLLMSNLALEVSRTTLDYGEDVTLTGTVEGPPVGSTITFSTDDGSGATPLGSCQTGATGSCSVSVKPFAELNVRASYAGDGTYSPWDTDPVRIGVHVVVSGRMLRSSGHAGRYSLYGPRRNVVYRARVRPPHPDRRVRILFAYNFGSGWRIADSKAFRQDDDGYVVIYFRGGSLPPGKYRLQTSQGPDADHLGGRSKWSYFRVTGTSRVSALRVSAALLTTHLSSDVRRP